MQLNTELKDIKINIKSDKKLKPYYPGIPEFESNVIYYRPCQLVVIFNKTYVDVEGQKQFHGYNFTDINPEINSALIEVPEDQVDMLKMIINMLTFLPEVEYANLNIVDGVDPPNLATSNEKTTWGQEAIRCSEAWKVTKGSPDVSVAIIDTGIDYHEDIKEPEAERDFVEANWRKKDTRAEDLVGRGTKWAGIIFGIHDFRGVNGVAPDCTFYSVKVTDDEDGAIFSTTDVWRLARGITYASSPLHMNADVLCIPLTAELDKDFCLPIEIACKIARNINHCIIIASSGSSNGDSENDDVMSRIATYDTTICVGAVDSNSNRFKYSPYGKELDVVAPGVNIYTTNISNTYEYTSDTGAATAFVAGTAALYFSERGIKNPKLSDIKNCEESLKENAFSLGESKYYGNGLIDTHLTTKYGRRLVIDFTWTPTSPKAGSEVIFTSESYDPDGKINKIAWDFENNGHDDSWLNPTKHIYPKAGTYKCTLWVKSSDGETRQFSKHITVQKRKSIARYEMFLGKISFLKYFLKSKNL